MKQLFFSLLIITNALSLFSQSERVLSFHSDIVVDTSSTITVQETIKIYANGTIFKRGITRTIPTQLVDDSGKRVKLDYKILSVERDGQTSKYHTESTTSTITIYVGERDVF